TYSTGSSRAAGTLPYLSPATAKRNEKTALGSSTLLSLQELSRTVVEQPPSVPALFLFSTADSLIRAQDVLRYAYALHHRGVMIQTHLFDTPHVRYEVAKMKKVVGGCSNRVSKLVCVCVFLAATFSRTRMFTARFCFSSSLVLRCCFRTSLLLYLTPSC